MLLDAETAAIPRLWPCLSRVVCVMASEGIATALMTS